MTSHMVSERKALPSAILRLRISLLFPMRAFPSDRKAEGDKVGGRVITTILKLKAV